MNLDISVSPEVGEQSGSALFGVHSAIKTTRSLPRLKAGASKAFFIALLFIFSVPLTTFAASLTYLRQNAPDFLEKIENDYGEMINISALLHDYDKNLIAAVIVVESEGKETAQSHRGAQGLMQLMPPTAKSMGVKDANDPFQNILAGTKYLKQLEGQYGFNSPEEALVAYNMGPSRARRWLSQYSPEDYGYVQKVMYVYEMLNAKEPKERTLAHNAPTTTLNAYLAKHLEETRIAAAGKSIMTKPRALSLAQLPLTLPVTRRIETQAGK